MLAALNPRQWLMLAMAVLALIVLIVAFIFFIFNPNAFVLLMGAVIAGIGLYGYLKYRETRKRHKKH